MSGRRPPPIRVLAAAFVALGLAVGAASCIEDLPAATDCPPEPKQQATSCIETIAAATPGCLADQPAGVGCLTGDRADCRCMSRDCPARDGACYPNGDCPAAVTDRASEASCKRLAPEDIGLDQPSASMCLCRCAGCAAVCDGIGPVMGVKTNSTFQAFPVIFDVKSRMPSSGRLGIYMRVRGIANVAVAIATGDLNDFDNLVWIEGYYVLTPPGTDYVEHVLFDDDFLHGPAYEWKRAEDKPAVVALAASFEKDDENLALFELDCLVPFVIPL